MAFVYKSENDYNSIYNFENELGPGEYLDKDPKPETRQNQEPFLSSTNRKFIQENEVPGPGTYYKDFQKIKNKKNLIKSEHNQNIDSVHARIKKQFICLRPAEKLGFDSKSKRFKSDTKIEEKTPGPGHYFPSILNNEEKNKNAKIKNDNSRRTFVKIKSNFSHQQTGYPNFVIEGSNINKKCRKTFQYDNFGCRPKFFGFRKYREFLELNDSNSLASTNYSDNKRKNKQIMNSFYYSNKSGEYSQKESKKLNDSKNSDKIKKIYKNSSEGKNTFNYRITLCKKMNKRRLRNKDDLDKLIENKTPGPGYYFDNIHDTGIYPALPKSDFFQFFGSKVRKFHSLDKPWTQLGPGEYFNPRRYINNDNSNDLDIPFGSKEKRNNTFLCLDNVKLNPGPGEYESQSFINILEKEINPDIDPQFGIRGERFNDKYVMKDKYSAPGPGYYEPKIETIALNNERLNYKNVTFSNFGRPRVKQKIKKLKKIDSNQFVNGVNASVEEFKYKEKIPPVGYYFPEFFNTIDYKNKKMILDSKHEGICFNRTISNGLKKSSSTSDLLGPGYYNINRDKKSIYFQVDPPFHSSCEKRSFPTKKEKYPINMEEFKKYYMKEFFNWNKRSHNVNFI